MVCPLLKSTLTVKPFSGNNSLALENLPVELINKIKVYDKKSDLEKMTGVSSGKENYVLDLQTKKNSTALCWHRVKPDWATIIRRTLNY